MWQNKSFFKKLSFEKINISTINQYYIKKIFEIKTNWKKVVNTKNFTNISKVNSNDDDYCLMCDLKKLIKMFENTIL